MKDAKKAVKMMKQTLMLLLVLMLVLLCGTALADQEARNPVPQEIRALFESSAWDKYEIPRVTDAPEYYAYAGYDQGDGYGAALIILRDESENRNVLCLVEKKNGTWRLTSRNHEALPRSEEVPYLYCEMYGQLEVYFDISEPAPDTLLFNRRSNGKWYLSWMESAERDVCASVQESRIVYYTGRDNQYSETVYGVYDSAFEAFNWYYFPATPDAAQESMTYAPVIPQNPGDASALASPVQISFRKGEKYDVFSAPGRRSYRPANGKAVMSTNDWVQVFGEEDGWLLVQYDISSEQMRFGYIDASALPRGTEVRTLQWQRTPCVTRCNTSLTDDPLNSAKTLLRLRGGEEVTCLATMGSWLYVETETGGKTIRGFLPAQDVDVVNEQDWEQLNPNG